MRYWANGLGATASLFGTKQNFATTGKVWFVDSETGTDGSHGENEKYPVATLGQAVTNAADGDTVVLASTHDETISGSTLSISKRLNILGSGSSSGIPMPRIRCTPAQGVALLTGADGSVVSNVRFSTPGESDIVVYLNGVDGVVLDGCYFDVSDEGDSGGLLSLNGTSLVRVVRCSFVSAATEENPAVTGVSLAGTSHTLFDECVLDAGLYGWASGIAMTASDAQTALQLRDLTLLRGSDVSVHASSTGCFNVSSVSGQGRVIW